MREPGHARAGAAIAARGRRDPGLQDGTPRQQRVADPQEAPLPGGWPVAIEDFGTMLEEQVEGEPLDSRLDREEPEEKAVFAPRAAGDGGQPASGRVGPAGGSVTA